MTASSVKSRELVPVLKRNVHGEPEHLENLIAGHRARGTLVNHSRPVWDPYIGSYCLTLVYRQPRPRWLVRVRRRAVERVWPQGEPATGRALRVLAYAAGMVLGAVGGFLTYEVVLGVIWLYEFIRHYFASIVAVVFLVALIGSVIAGAGACAHRCGIHH